jgi:hypothetical protein
VTFGTRAPSPFNGHMANIRQSRLPSSLRSIRPFGCRMIDRQLRRKFLLAEKGPLQLETLSLSYK